MVGEHREQAAHSGASLAMPPSTPEAFAITCGIAVPVDTEMTEEVFDAVLERVPDGAGMTANERPFATVIDQMPKCARS